MMEGLTGQPKGEDLCPAPGQESWEGMMYGYDLNSR